MIINIKKLHIDAQIPNKASKFAGGWDVTATEIIYDSENFVICKLGFALQPPTNYKVTLVPRSSLTKSNWILQNSPGLGDPDYIGEYQYRFRCMPVNIIDNKLQYESFPYIIGDRIGQIYLEKIIPMQFHYVDTLVNTIRGAGGFGHTGNN